ncbi:pyridoxamine 5'-phosphate oxidase family protein [Streptomyces niveus]|uniref:Pyridoxamine 5-phosphate oxidase n=1 Tax=Streptomyces niveus TaxID=193462 RepID=A0A1U9R0D6_STRNV|nr:pyridoxamine 5'-phosphate oxidase family protein [Streptomyces niveus]AQU69693.1 pyridoxamine 5-phosphate oxidase [Streptomyces niveus]
MATWYEIRSQHTEFADKVSACFAAGVNKTIATLRRDGSPRISAIELEFKDGDVTLGMMGGSVKLRDARRDPRVAVHSPTIDAPEGETWHGDAKLSGVLVETPAPAGNPHVGAGFFRIDIREVALTYLGTPADHLVIESWHAGHGWRRRTH